MTGCFGNSLEDREMQRDLDRQQDGEAKEDSKAEWIEKRVDVLMQKGNDYHPWEFANFSEALANAPDHEQEALFCAVAAAVKDMGKKNDFANHCALTAIGSLVENYWQHCAEIAARKEYERAN